MSILSVLGVSMYNKPILHSFDEQILKLKENGVKFNNISINEAKEYLEKHNYYFKLTSYRKNYDKEPENNLYIRLDFFALKELAKLDMLFRAVVMNLSLNVEHNIKLFILNYISNKKDDDCNFIENGYNIVKKYLQSLDDNNKYKLNEEITRNIKSIYCKDLLNKIADGFDIENFDYKNNTNINLLPIFQINIPLWAFLEIITFGSVVSFVKFVGDEYQNNDIKKYHYLLKTCNKIRNAAAHSSCILNDLRKGKAYSMLDYGIRDELKKKFKVEELKKRLSNERLIQFVTLLYLHKKIVISDSSIKRVKDELHTLSNRLLKNIDKIDNDLIENTFNFIKKVIDFWY